MEQTLSANLEPKWGYDDSLVAPLAGAMAYGGYHPTVPHSSFAVQKAGGVEPRQILDLTPLFAAVLGSGRDRHSIDQMRLDFLGTTHSRRPDIRPDAELHPEGLEPVEFQWNVAFSNGLPFECEFRSRRSDGTYRSLLARCRTLRDEEGQVYRWQVAFIDIEDHKRDEERLGEKAATPAETGLDDERLQRVLDYIAANLRSDMTLERLAEVACYSTFHFARKFTLAMGIPPHRYIGRIRMENAIEELNAGKLSLVEIAFNANFSSQASFTRAFRRATGTTPDEYRRRRR